MKQSPDLSYQFLWSSIGDLHYQISRTDNNIWSENGGFRLWHRIRTYLNKCRMRILFFLIIENKCGRSRRRTLRFHLLVSFLPENPLSVKELFVGDAIGSAPCRFWHSTCKTFIDDSCPLFTANFMCDLIHNITSWGYYLIGKRECHGTHSLPCTIMPLKYTIGNLVLCQNLRYYLEKYYI